MERVIVYLAVVAVQVIMLVMFGSLGPSWPLAGLWAAVTAFSVLALVVHHGVGIFKDDGPWIDDRSI